MIWCVDDDSAIRDIELYALNSTGFTARGFADGLMCWQALEQGERPQLIILDVMMPELDGVELLRKIKSSPALRAIPIIMATAKGSEYDKIQSLDLGADDYLVKPFGIMEMISRVKAVLRRCSPQKGEAPLQVDGLELNLSEHTVTAHGQRIMLTFKEFELLHLFMTHPGTAFTREQLLAEVWNSDFMGETRTVDVHIRTLRQKLGEHGRLIETVRGVGYRLEARHDR